MYKKFILAILLFISLVIYPFTSNAATLLTDDFTGTTIDTVKWTEIDPSGTVSQNNSVTISGSYVNPNWGVAGLDSKDTFSRTNLSVSANMSGGSAQLLGYGDRNFQSAGTAAYIFDIVGASSYALAWNNGSMDGGSNMACGATTAGAKYTITPTLTGFSVYKDTGGGDVLMCSATVNTSITNKGIFLASQDSATFDNVLVTGTANNSAPDAPTSLSATAGNTQASLSWTAPVSNGGSAIIDYLVEYKLSTEPTVWTTFSDGTSTNTTATVTGLTNDLVYNFRVSAINAIGTSVPSDTTNATPSLPTEPGAPTGLSGTAGNTQASLSWTAPVSNGGSAIIDYLVEYKLSTEPTVWTTFSDGTFTNTTATVTGLTNDLVYNFRVSAINGIGTGVPSSVANVTPGVETPITISNISLWLDSSDATNITESSGLISQINDKSGNNKNGTASGSVRPTLVSNVQNGRSIMRFDGNDDYLNINSSIAYRTVFVVAKYDNASFSGYDGIVGDFTGSSPGNGHVVNGVDGTRKIATATSNYASAYRNGTSISGSGGHDFTPLNEFWIGSFEISSTMTNTTSSIGMINGGGRYWDGDIAEIIAYSSTLTNTERAQIENYLSVKWGITVTGPSAPDAPTSLGASRGDTQIVLSWTAPADDGGSLITDYVIEYKLTSEPTVWTTFSDGTSTNTTAIVTGLTNDLSYDFRVKAVNPIGTSVASDTATKTPGPPIAPGAPTSVIAEGGNTQATITFTAPVDNGGASITSYIVTSSPGGLTVSGASSPLVITGLSNGTEYTFTVTATNSVGTSISSSASNAITPSTLGNQLTENFTGTTINIDKWYEYDPTGAGGTTGKIRQNGNLTIADSYSGSWGQNALISQDIFDSTSLEISSSMTAVSAPLIGYGDYDFGGAGKKAYLLYITAPGSSILALSWDGASSYQTSCGNADAGAAVYKMKLISGGFEVYKGATLMCTHNTSVVVNNKPVFFESSASASTFDDILVYGIAPIDSVPDAPTIGTATAGNASATVTFTPPSFNGGNAISGYTVISSPGNITSSGASSPITITGLTNDVAYTFTVKATNSQGDSVASSASNSVTPALPEAPGQVTGLVATGFNKQVLLGWDAPFSGGTPTDYIVEYKLSGVSSWSTFNDGTSTSKKAIVTGLINGSQYDFRVSGSNDGNPGTASTTISATPDEISNLSFVITGESNSGGIGQNSSATAGEIASRSSVQILELTSGNFLFENLDIGTNNLRDHAGLSGYYECCHGLELGLANSVEANAFPDNAQVYLIKTGQGGSQVSQWNYAGTYFTKFLQRTASAKTQIPADRKWVVWMSIGINDGIAGTNINTFKANLTTYIDNIKADLPGAIIIMTQFQSMPANSGYPTINTALADVAALEPNVYVVDTTSATGTDGANHWTYSGLKTVASLMTTTTKNVLGLNYPGLPTSLITTPTSNSIALSWTAPVANGGSAITDYLIEYKVNSSNTWLTFNDGTSTSTSATVTGLSDGTNYDLRVSAVSANGTGNSVAGTALTPDDTPPSTPVANVDAGTYNTTQSVVLSATGSDYIKYSLTETPTTCGTGTLYEGAISVSESKTIYVRACDDAGNSSTASFEYTIDANAPLITSLSTPVLNAQEITLSWITNKNSSTKVDYGLTNTYGTSTLETNTSPRVTDHTVTLSGLTSCTTYHYRVRSKDIATNEVIGTDNTFTTIGCTGSATVNSETASSVSTATGGTTNLTSGGTGIELEIPAGATGTDAVFQIKALDQEEVFLVSGTPSGLQTIGNYAFDLKALTDIGTTVTTFLEPITLTLTYQDSDVVGINESSLVIYRWDGNTWSALSNCVVNTTLNTVTCDTSNFSVFSIFGNLAQTNNRSSSGSYLPGYGPNRLALATTSTIIKYNFSRNLKYGMIGEDVKKLQEYLNKNGFIVTKTGLGSPGKETTKFGPATRSALIKFQKAKNIYPSIGFFGPITRGEVNK